MGLDERQDVLFQQRTQRVELEDPRRSHDLACQVEMMASNSTHSNGANGAMKANRYDPNFTDSVINAVGPDANPRMRKVMASLVRHLHDFCRENEITVDEYMAGIELVSKQAFYFFDRLTEFFS